MFRNAIDSTGGAVNAAFAGMSAELWLVIPGGLILFGIIYGLGRTKKAAKVAAA